MAMTQIKMNGNLQSNLVTEHQGTIFIHSDRSCLLTTFTLLFRVIYLYICTVNFRVYLSAFFYYVYIYNNKWTKMLAPYRGVKLENSIPTESKQAPSLIIFQQSI